MVQTASTVQDASRLTPCHFRARRSHGRPPPPAPHITHSSDQLLLAKGDTALQACLDRIRAQEAIARANKLNTKAYVDDLKF